MPLATFLPSLPTVLVNALEEEFRKLHQQYLLGRWESSQLDGGRFGEIVFRILEFKDARTYTPLSSHINRETIVHILENNTSLYYSLRLTIPKLAALIMDFRNNRNVAHVGEVTVNAMDSSFVVHASNWIMAELVRTEAHLSPEEAQNEILKIIERKIPLIEEIGGRLRVLDPRLTVKNRILVFVYQKYPTATSEGNLRKWVEEANRSRFRKYLINLHNESLIDFHDGMVTITKRGVIFVEKNISFELVI